MVKNIYRQQISKEEFAAEFRSGFKQEPETVTYNFENLISSLSEICYVVQMETEKRVRQEMLRRSLN